MCQYCLTVEVRVGEIAGCELREAALILMDKGEEDEVDRRSRLNESGRCSRLQIVKEEVVSPLIRFLR